VVSLVVSAAPPALRIGELVDLLVEAGWIVTITATPTAATWIDQDALAARTGHPVRSRWRMPGDPEVHPKADVVVVVPATFNLLNKWALGISDNVALGVLHELLGLGVPVLAFPCAKPALTSHPRYADHLRLLTEAGVRITDIDALRNDDGTYRWQVITELLP
jgi:phosphopantothenoylcysteine synthetase/decarboxylase